jgi:membrane-associated phospholipid phosphatase
LGIEHQSGYGATKTLIQTVLQITERVGYVYKARFARPRPNAIDPTLRPFLPDPPHPAYPSNHAFQNFSVAEVMSRAIPEASATTELFHVARRIGENREYAGLHYPSDTRAGEELARAFAPYLLYVCRSKIRLAQREWYT